MFPSWWTADTITSTYFYVFVNHTAFYYTSHFQLKKHTRSGFQGIFIVLTEALQLPLWKDVQGGKRDNR